MIKWRLMLTTLPFVLVVVALKVGLLETLLHVRGVLDFGDVGFVLTGGIFLIGFMLAGTMADYKEAERLPGEVACALETLEETFVMAVPKTSLDPKSMRAALLKVADTIHDWLHRKVPAEALFASLERLAEVTQALDRGGSPPPVDARALNELHGLRRSLTRMHVISKTAFLATGYALLETLTVVVLLLLLISNYKSLLAELVLVSLVTLIYVYMVRLIRDMDDPFEYGPDGQRGAAEVDLFILHDYRKRLVARVRADQENVQIDQQTRQSSPKDR